MRKIIILFFISFILTGCVVDVSLDTNETQSSTVQFDGTDETDTSENTETTYIEKETGIPDSELNIIQRVMLNMDKFIYANSKEILNIKEFCDEDPVSVNGENYYGRYFYYLELGDDRQQVVLVETASGKNLVFYEMNGWIYAFKGKFCEMMFENGIYVNEAYQYKSIGHLVKTQDGHIEPNGLLKVSWLYDTRYYDGNGNHMSIEKGEEMLEKYMNNVEAKKYDFNRDNIENILSDWGEK